MCGERRVGRELGSNLNATDMFCKGHAYLLAASNIFPFPLLSSETVSAFPGRSKRSLQFNWPKRTICCIPQLSTQADSIVFTAEASMTPSSLHSSTTAALLWLSCAGFPSHHQTLFLFIHENKYFVYKM